VKIRADDRISHDAMAAPMECPSCREQGPMTPISRPDFASLKACRPEHAGLVFLCLRCQAPVFVRYKITSIGEDEIDLQANPQPGDKTEERLNMAYLPPAVAKSYKDALGCYQHGLYEAFALMCRQVSESVIHDLGERGKMKVFNHIEELRGIVELDSKMFDTVSRAVFGDEGTHTPDSMTRSEAAVLLEILKDLLYQTYVREARLKRALKMRSFFASAGTEEISDEDTVINPKITQLRTPRS